MTVTSELAMKTAARQPIGTMVFLADLTSQLCATIVLSTSDTETVLDELRTCWHHHLRRGYIAAKIGDDDFAYTSVRMWDEVGYQTQEQTIESSVIIFVSWLDAVLPKLNNDQRNHDYQA